MQLIRIPECSIDNLCRSHLEMFDYSQFSLVFYITFDRVIFIAHGILFLS